MKDKYPTMKLSELKPHPNNPRTHTEEQIEKIAQSIDKLGWGRPIIISSDNYILAGHGAATAADTLNMTDVPVRQMPHQHDSPEALAYMVADNKLTDESDWNYADLELVFEDLKLEHFDISLTGFEEDFQVGVPTGELMNKYDKDGRTHNGTLVEDFGCPPFTVFNSSQGYWQNLKTEWLNIIKDRGQARKDALGTQLGTSIMDPVLSQLIINWFTPTNGTTFDPFAGDTIFGFISGYLGHKFIGIELRKEQVQFNQSKCDKFQLPSNYICEDAINIDKHLKPESQDLLFSCPPYFDLEVYSDLSNDASNQNSYEEFMEIINNAFTKSINILKEDRFAVIVCGDIRNKKGFYYRFPDHIKNIFEENNIPLYNEAILINPVGSARIRARNSFKNRKLVKTHQNVLIFYKGNADNIKENFPKTPNCVGEINED